MATHAVLQLIKPSLFLEYLARLERLAGTKPVAALSIQLRLPCPFVVQS